MYLYFWAFAARAPTCFPNDFGASLNFSCFFGSAFGGLGSFGAGTLGTSRRLGSPFGFGFGGFGCGLSLLGPGTLTESLRATMKFLLTVFWQLPCRELYLAYLPLAVTVG
jgi:hypothetical protein